MFEMPVLLMLNNTSENMFALFTHVCSKSGSVFLV